MAELSWYKSSYSEEGGNNCVEVAVRDDMRIALRHSVYPARGFSVGQTAFSAFVNAVRVQALDDILH
ncbi:DUF397 domain-containing protein [Streptomyces sp. YIM S03343]